MSNTVLKLSLCLLSIATVATLPATVDAAPNYSTHLIQPGKSLGPCKLGAWTTTLKALKSCAPQDNDAALGHYIDRYQASPSDACDTLRVYAVRDAATGGEKETIEQVWTSSPTFATSSGVRVGDTLTHVKRAFPGISIAPSELNNGTKVAVYDDRKAGIAFIFRNSKCSAIIIHPRGKSVTDEYMPFSEIAG